MGLTVSRKTAKNLAVRRKNERILTVNAEKILPQNNTMRTLSAHYAIHRARPASIIAGFHMTSLKLKLQNY